MATVNKYFQSGIPGGNSSEQNLYESIIIESMKIYGFEVFYIPRSSYNEDRIFGEDPLNRFQNAFPIEMYMENINGYEGQGELLSKFGVTIADTANFIVSRRRWTDIIGSTGTSILPRPAEGDVIYFPLTKSYFEIRRTEGDKPFFQLGKLYVYKLYCELLVYSNEVISTGNPDIDIYPASLDMNILDYELLTESGDQLANEYHAADPIILESFGFNKTIDIGARNDDFATNITSILDFSEKNPFGDIIV
jgi:hypothetical protein